MNIKNKNKNINLIILNFIITILFSYNNSFLKGIFFHLYNNLKT